MMNLEILKKAINNQAQEEFFTKPVVLPSEAKFITGKVREDSYLHYLETVCGVEIQFSKNSSKIVGYNVIDEKKFSLCVEVVMRNKTITVDLESWSSSPTVLGNTTNGIYPLQPYQQVLWDRMNQGGLKKGQMTLYSAGRGVGKSTLNAYYGTIFSTNLCNEILLPMKPASKYKFSRAKWYEAGFGPADYLKVREVREWCVEQFGPEPRNHDAWSRWYHKNHNRIFFRDEKDYVWFMLRWS